MTPVLIKVKPRAVRRNFSNGMGWRWYLRLRLADGEHVDLERDYRTRALAVAALKSMT